MGSHLLVGNRMDYDGQGGTGVVYEFDVHTGALVRTFVNPDPPASFFGEVIVTRPRDRIADRTGAQGGGDLVAIGRTTLGLGPGHYVPGSVELFDDATGSLIRRFRDPSPYATDQIDGFCGGRQPVTFAGPLLAVEANSGDDAGPGTGQIYLFDLATGRLSRTLTPSAPFNIPQTNFGDDGLVAVGDELTVQANYFPSSTQQIGVVYRIASATGVIRKLVALPGAGAILGAFGTAEFWVFGSSEDLIDPASGASIYHFAFPGYVEPTVAPGAPIVVSSSTSGPNGPRGVVTLFPPIAICGNGVTEPGEHCDDANLVDGDGCDSNCTPTGCGNGIVSAGEVCDDGNGHSGDGCSADCTALCGNRITEPGEECDDGNLVDGDGCDVNCTVSGCGNGILTAGEACDDGNSVDGDGCSSACEPEALDVSGTWQVSTLFVGFQTTRFLSIVAGSTPGSFTFGDASLCGTRAVAGPGLVATCPITSSNSTGTALGNAFSLPDTGWYVDDVTLAAPAGDEGIIRLVENVRLVGRIEGQNGRAERITGREYRFGDDYDTSGALRGTGSASNPAILTMVMRRADAPVGTNVTVSPTDGATVTFAQVVGGGDAGAIPRADATGTLPSGFVVTGSSVVNFNGYVDVLTTASPTGAFVTCMAYPDLDNDGFVDLRTPALPETQLRILHAENGSFVDRTVSLDPVHNIICAQTSSLSEFVVGTGATAPSTTSTTTTTHVGSSSTTSTMATSTSTTTTLPSVSTCGTTPSPGCLSAFSGKASIALAAGATAANDKLTWKWVSSGAVAQADFGDPPATTGYDLCVYDQRGLLTTARVPAGGQCGVKPCWKSNGSGAKYTNKALTPDGVLTVSLKPGAVGRGKIGLKAKKERLRLPTLPLVPRVTVQLRRVDTGACWGATYGSATVNVATKFKAKSD